MFETLKKRVVRYKTNKSAIRELHSLTDRDLADIGIKRYDIERVVTSYYAN